MSKIFTFVNIKYNFKEVVDTLYDIGNFERLYP